MNRLEQEASSVAADPEVWMCSSQLTDFGQYVAIAERKVAHAALIRAAEKAGIAVITIAH